MVTEIYAAGIDADENIVMGTEVINDTSDSNEIEESSIEEIDLFYIKGF